MKCSVKSCSNKECGEPAGNNGFRLCQYHWRMWQYFHWGYEHGHFGDQDSTRHGRLNRSRWKRAMLSFLDCCEVEIVACTQIANTLIGTMKVIELGRTEARVADRAKDGCLLCGGSREILVVPKRVIGYTGDDIDEKLVPCPLCSIEE